MLKTSNISTLDIGQDIVHGSGSSENQKPRSANKLQDAPADVVLLERALATDDPRVLLGVGDGLGEEEARAVAGVAADALHDGVRQLQLRVGQRLRRRVGVGVAPLGHPVERALHPLHRLRLVAEHRLHHLVDLLVGRQACSEWKLWPLLHGICRSLNFMSMFQSL